MRPSDRTSHHTENGMKLVQLCNDQLLAAASGPHGPRLLPSP